MKLPTKFRIGARNPKTHRLDFAFNIERTEQGGIRITEIKKKLRDRDRRALFAHFGVAKGGDEGGEQDGLLVTRFTTAEPGSVRHFMRACRSLPEPFRTMSESYEKSLR